MTGTCPAAWHLDLVCDLKAVPGAAAAARHFLLAQGCGEPESVPCELALVEACNNAILHTADPKLPIGLEVLCSPEQIELRITDHAEQFEWPARIELPDVEQETGRGLYLIVSVMDSVRYSHGSGANVLVLSKRRTA